MRRDEGGGTPLPENPRGKTRNGRKEVVVRWRSTVSDSDVLQVPICCARSKMGRVNPIGRGRETKNE